MLQELNRLGPARYHHASNSICEKITVYTKFPAEFLLPQFETNRMSIRRLALPGLPEILLAAIHFPSKLHFSDQEQALEATVLAQQIREAEQLAQCERTVLVGDLNMNPFENGVIAANGLHGVMTREIAARQTRTVQDQTYPFFYNPMWGRLGDATEGPAGSYYYAHSGHTTYFWNSFDQVLLRPALLQYFRDEELKILTDDGELSLVSDNGLPDKKTASDHLPILFKLHL